VINRPGLNRRQLLGAALGLTVTGALAACGTRTVDAGGNSNALVAAPSGTPTGPLKEFTLTAQQSRIDLGGTIVDTWTYGDQLPGKPIRLTRGERARITVTNQLPTHTSVHWHGLAIPNDMDGVPDVTTPGIEPGSTFTYDFDVPDSGTHWFHPHHGVQLDRGLYAPFIVDDPEDPGDYDHEWVLVLDDWIDGTGTTPEQVLDNLVNSGGQDHGHMGMSGHGGGDVTYPLHLINGRSNTDPDSITVKGGQRIRLRIVNAAADTLYHVGVPGHDLLITHTDGYPVQPRAAGSLLISMGERYDTVLTVGDASVPFIAAAVGKDQHAHGLIRVEGSSPPDRINPGLVDQQPVGVEQLTSLESVRLPAAEIAHEQRVVLEQGRTGPYVWTINGKTYENTVPLTTGLGDTGRLNIFNHSMMPHPLHLHGHTFQIGPAGGTGARKDTLLLTSHAQASVDYLANNPGNWMLHCHNGYHAEAGMTTRLDYTA